ncbi:hypothetical protein BSL78_14956 [Apostichopus japonicus]|uniref:Uncharacterized protein n=1 Tax=Stichopus japonicus TaxID=307972 RepID=A0A2G8KJI9_STIJA|nr:hypothetical protein BSL78_14956 [Apostichopus japonicus]
MTITVTEGTKSRTEYRQVNEHGEHQEIDVSGLVDKGWREERKKPTEEEERGRRTTGAVSSTTMAWITSTTTASIHRTPVSWRVATRLPGMVTGTENPYGDDMLVPPKPTGAPVRRFLEERLDINLELRIIRINRGEDDMFPAVDVSMTSISVKYSYSPNCDTKDAILHYPVTIYIFQNISAYSMPSSGVCYIQPLDMQSTLTPEGFQDLLDTEAYKDMDFPMNSKLYTVNPERATDLGDHIEECVANTTLTTSAASLRPMAGLLDYCRQVLRDHFGDEEEAPALTRRGDLAVDIVEVAVAMTAEVVVIAMRRVGRHSRGSEYSSWYTAGARSGEGLRRLSRARPSLLNLMAAKLSRISKLFAQNMVQSQNI